MKILEGLFIVIISIGAFFGIMGYPGSSIQMTLGLTMLSFLYQVFSFWIFNGIGFRKMFKKESYDGIPALAIIFSVIMGFILPIALLGILFKYMLYPGFAVMLTTAMITVIPSFIASIVLSLTKEDQKVYKRILLRITPIIFLTVLFYSIPADSIIDFKYGHCPEYSSLMKRQVRGERIPNRREAMRAAEKDCFR